MKIADPRWRLKNLYYIVDKNSNKIRFKENSIQEIVNSKTDNRKIILKARQFGISTNELLKQFDKTIFTKNFTSCILAHEQDAIKKLFRIVRRAYEFMDPRLKPRLERGGGSKYEMYFPEINSRIYCDLESRGDTINWLHVSEAAFMKDSAKLKSTLQAVPLEKGIATIETTPNGMANYFYDLWNDPDAPYLKLFFPWYLFAPYKIATKESLERTEEERELVKKAKRLFNVDITDSQIAFRRFKKRELKKNDSDIRLISFEQEYPEDDASCFLSSTETVMDLEIVNSLLKTVSKPLRDIGHIRIYRPPDKTALYACGADTAEGVGGDYSVGVIMDRATREVVAVIRGHFKPIDFAHKLAALCRAYKTPLKRAPVLAVERNNHGHAVLQELSEHIKYENIYRHTDEKLGWNTDRVTRPIMINTFINAVENKNIIINDKQILSECMTLVNDDGKIQAAKGKHDDCIIATSIALQICLTYGNVDVYDNISSKILV